MPLERHPADFPVLTGEDLAAWADVPAAVASDAMGRARTMAAAIKPLKPGTRLLGQARTVRVPVGDNTAIHVAVALARPGEILVVDAGGHEETTVWGGILTQAAQARGIVGVVVDGGTRDAAEIAASGFAFYCRSVSPRGGQKGGSGMVDGPLAVGGVDLASGDLVVGDDDGIAIVPLARQAAVLAEVKAVLKREETLLSAIAEGRTTAEILGITIPDVNS